MRISVAICTRNRAAHLTRALEQMTKLRIPSDTQWEMIVVNNNCTDATDDVLSAFDTRLPIRRLFEARSGKSHALNLAAQEATGEYILWTDDDVLVDPNWLAAYRTAFARWPEAAVFGGPIEPLFEDTPPMWLQRVLPRIEGAYAFRDIGRTPQPIAVPTLPYGANLAIRAREQSLHKYDPRLGPQPHSAILGEEVTCVRSILASGSTGWWVPEARVRHFIPKDRQTITYLRRYFSGYGEFLGRTSPDRTSPRIFGQPRWLWRQAIQAEARYRLLRLFSRPEVWIEQFMQSAISWGYIRGHTLPYIDIDPMPRNPIRRE